MDRQDNSQKEMKSLLMAMTVLVVTAVRERKSGGYNGGYYWDRGRDVFPGEGYDFSPFVTERDPWECAKRCVGHQRCTHFHQNFDTTFLCYLKSINEYKTEGSKYLGATCGWIPGRSNYDIHHIDRTYENDDGGVKFRETCDFLIAEDVGNKEMPLDKCGRSCVKEKRCNAFSYTSGRCFQKKVPQHFNKTETTSSIISGFLPWQFPDTTSDEPM